MSRLCLVKVLHYEAQKYVKKKNYLECDKCVFKDNCKVKESAE